MAGNNDRDGIQGIRMSDGAGGGGLIESGGESAISPGGAGWNRTQCLPDAFLERAASGADFRGIEGLEVSGKVLAQRLAKIQRIGTAAEFGCVIAFRKQTLHTLLVSGKIERADRFAIRGKQDAADG